MKQAKINRDRAKRAELALKSQGYWDCGESYAAADLIDDIMHLCVREGWSFERVLESAREHFDCEHTSPDDIELHSARPMHKRGDYPILPEQMSGKAKAQRGVELLTQARELFKAADNRRTVERIKGAISSARGAVRIQEGRAVRRELAL